MILVARFAADVSLADFVGRSSHGGTRRLSVPRFAADVSLADFVGRSSHGGTRRLSGGKST